MTCECGREFYVRDLNGANVTRFVAIRDGWLGLQRDLGLPMDNPVVIQNGVRMTWQGVLGYLARLGKIFDPRGRMDIHSDRGIFFLGPVMRVSEFAAVLGQDAKLVRDELTDLVIQVED